MHSRAATIPATVAVPLIADDAIVDALVLLLTGAVLRKITSKEKTATRQGRGFGDAPVRARPRNGVCK